MSRRSIVSKAQTSPTHNPRLATRLGQSLSKQNLLRTARNIGPILVALTFATAANAQGTMDFSGAQTLMGTFNWRNDYVAIQQWSRNIVCDNYVHLAQLHEQHERFAKTWDGNLRSQGFAEVFTDKCILG
jgi:uncharacterized protein DUF6908